MGEFRRHPTQLRKNDDELGMAPRTLPLSSGALSGSADKSQNARLRAARSGPRMLASCQVSGRIAEE